MNQNHSFWESLFDFSFSRFVTTRIVGIIYILGIALVALVALFLIGASFQFGGGQALISVIGVLLGAFLYILFIRVGLEALVSALKTAENTGRILEILKRNAPN